MRKDKQLGQAIEAALLKKRATHSDMARHFGVDAALIAEWIEHGDVSEPLLAELRDYFADCVGPEHWDLPDTGLSPGGDSNITAAKLQEIRDKASPQCLTLLQRIQDDVAAGHLTKEELILLEQTLRGRIAH